MIEGYSTEEVVECCQEYLKVQKGIGNPILVTRGRLAGKGTSGRKSGLKLLFFEIQNLNCLKLVTKIDE